MFNRGSVQLLSLIWARVWRGRSPSLLSHQTHHRTSLARHSSQFPVSSTPTTTYFSFCYCYPFPLLLLLLLLSLAAAATATVTTCPSFCFFNCGFNVIFLLLLLLLLFHYNCCWHFNCICASLFCQWRNNCPRRLDRRDLLVKCSNIMTPARGTLDYMGPSQHVPVPVLYVNIKSSWRVRLGVWQQSLLNQYTYID